MEFTNSQKLAIELRDRNILVSAAAGSGKTATLTERIIRLLTDPERPAEINRMLIVTFTRAAAGELRTRISKALSKYLSEDPGNRHIAMQLTALGGAKICTIDSYYLDLVKSNFQRISLPAKFRLADETELDLIRNETMNAVINRYYETDESFIEYADKLTTAKGESKLSDLLLEIANKLVSTPNGTAFLSKNANIYLESINKDLFDTKCGKDIVESLREEISDMIARCNCLIELIDSEPGLAPYGNAISGDYDFLQSFLASFEHGSYELSRNILFDYKPGSLGRISKNNKPESAESVKESRNEIKERISELKEKEFFVHPDDLPQICKESAEFCLKTKEIIDNYLEAYTNEKSVRNICEFSDLKKYALQLLINEDGTPSELAINEQKKFDHIFVDEYQDTDGIQDLIFNTISNGTNLFFVGDIKQSIYSFRGAEPSVFSKYRKAFLPAETVDCDPHIPLSVFMSENFRCSPNIISFTNAVCSYLFRESESPRGGIGYVAEDDLIASRPAPVSDEKVRIVLLEKNGEDAKEDVEAIYIIDEIRKLIQCGKLPNGSPISAGDIAILTRSNKEAAKISEALAKAGIPRANSAGNDLFENREVLLMLCFLTASDNPQRDIPLTGALRSPIFGFSMSDLINVRIGRTKTSLYDSICEYAEDPESNRLLAQKCRDAVRKLTEYRQEAESKPVHLFMRYLWKDTNALSYAGSDKTTVNRTPIERRRNLRKFYEYARRFESSNFKGLHEFLEYINGIIERGTKITDEDAATAETVRVMTVHKSKGLEFPVVFLIGTDKAPNEQDSRKSIVVSTSEDLGIACKISNETGELQIDTPHRIYLSNRISEKSLDEEIRILYVALTRARDRLYVIASGKEGFAEKKIENAYRVARIGGRFGIKSSPKWIDRILIALAAAPLNTSYAIDMPVVTSQANECQTEKEAVSVDPVRAEDIYKQLRESFLFRYGYDDQSQLPAKVSVSKLYPELLNESITEELQLFKAESLETKKPRFLADRASSAERGTATHLFMQFCNFDNLKPDRDSVSNEIARLLHDKFISSEIADMIRIEDIVKFAQSKLIDDLKASHKLYRELRFNVFIPASELTTEDNRKSLFSDEKILVQGVIDLCYFNSNGELVLCDYKTDHIPREILGDRSAIHRMLEDKHKQQLKYYTYAIEAIFGKKPNRVLIYSLPYGDSFSITI